MQIIKQINDRFADAVDNTRPGDGRYGKLAAVHDQVRTWPICAWSVACGQRCMGAALRFRGERFVPRIQLWPNKFHNVTNGITPRRDQTVQSAALRRCWIKR